MRTFYAPGHITGLFEVYLHEDPLRSGSRGAGIVIEEGVRTGVILEDSDDPCIRVFLNGKKCNCPTTKKVVKDILKETCGLYQVEVHHFTNLPVEYGMGTSASGAIGTALALNDRLELGLDYKHIGAIAHGAEVTNRTGLGDVIAEFSRGLVIRTKEGPPGGGSLRSINIDGEVVIFKIGKPLSTMNILLDGKSIDVINPVGARCLDLLLKRPDAMNFMDLSIRFTRETGVADKTVLGAIKELEEKGITASMCMLGNAVFTITDSPEDVQGLLDFPSIVTPILQRDIRTSDVYGTG